MLYVKNTDPENQDAITDNYHDGVSSSSGTINNYDMAASAKIANTCALIFKSSRFMKVVLEDPELELERSYSAGGLAGSVSFDSVMSTQVLRVSIRLNSALDTVQICKAIERQATKYYKNFFPTGEIFLVEEAYVPGAPISPNYVTNTLYGFMGGLVSAIGISLLIGFFDTTVKPNDDLYKMYKVPVFAEIYDMSNL